MHTLKHVIQIKFQLDTTSNLYFYQQFESENELNKWTYENEIYEYDQEVITIMIKRGEL